MLRLAILRHAKSSWDDPGLEDFDRPLNERGRRAAPIMGQVLASLKFFPSVVLCSASRRTRETLEQVAPFFSAPQPAIVFEDGLYLASAADLLARLRNVQPASASVLLIGHNPGLHALATRVAYNGDAGAIARLTARFPTAALALVSFPQDTWSDLAPETGQLDAFITPKDRA